MVAINYVDKINYTREYPNVSKIDYVLVEFSLLPRKVEPNIHSEFEGIMVLP